MILDYVGDDYVFVFIDFEDFVGVKECGGKYVMVRSEFGKLLGVCLDFFDEFVVVVVYCGVMC